MSFEKKTGLGVYSFYGPMTTKEGTEGSINSDGSIQELALELSGKAINNGSFARDLAYLAKSAEVKEVVVDVREVFTLGGTSPTIEVGTQGSEGTNGFSIPAADAQSAGVYVITSFNGTWASQLTADTDVGVALGGTSPTSADTGFARVVIRYYQLS